MMLNLRPIREDDLEGGVGTGYTLGLGLGYPAIIVLVNDRVWILPAK